MTALATSAIRRRAIPLDLRTGRAPKSGMRLAGRAVSIIAAGLILAPIVVVAMGYHPAIVATQSASPGIDRGDILLNEIVMPSAVQVGDIITYAPEPGSATVTGMVARVNHTGGTYSFSLEGSPSDTSAWSPSAQENVTRVALRSAFLDGALSVVSPLAANDPGLGLALGAAAVLLIGVVWMALASRTASPEYW